MLKKLYKSFFNLTLKLKFPCLIQSGEFFCNNSWKFDINR